MGFLSGLFRSRDHPTDSLNGSGYRFLFGGTSSGRRVNERSAMQMTAVYSCVRILSEAVAGLPLHLYKYTSEGSKEKAVKNPLYFLLHDEPNPEMTSFVFRETLMTHLLLWGKDIIMGIVNGIKSCISAVGDAVSSVAEKIKSFLHFSVPDEGPLTDYESWMPDFMKGLAKGIEDSKALVANAMDSVAADMVLSPNVTAATAADGSYGTDSSSLVSGIGAAVADALKNLSGQTGDIVIPVYVGGMLLDEMVVTAQTRQNLRSGGR